MEDDGAPPQRGSQKQAASRADDGSGAAGRSQPTSVHTWNARALICHDSRLAPRKERYLISLILRGDAVLVQETHGTADDLTAVIDKFNTSHVGFYSATQDVNQEGLLTLIRRDFMRSEVSTRRASACRTSCRAASCL